MPIMNPIIKKIIRNLIPNKLYSSLDGGLSILKEASYKSDGMITIHNVDFLNEPLFLHSFKKGLEDIPIELVDKIFKTIKWRAHICC